MVEHNLFDSGQTASAQTPASQTHIVAITGYGAGGEGVARLEDGRVVFVRSAARGDILEVKLTKEQPRSARAEAVRILTPSPHRIEPDCTFYPECGGCDFRHITYEEEIEAKLLRVNDALSRIGGLTIRASQILRTGRIDGYRNKAVLHSDGKLMGFYRSRSHDIIPITNCLLLKDDLNSALRGCAQGACGPCGPGAPYGPGDSCTPCSPGAEVTLRSGRNGLLPPLEEELDGLIFGVSGFFQVNTGAALLLYQKAREYAELSKSKTLIDLYCGAGALTLFAGRDAGFALGVELDRASTEAARENAGRNSISHAEFINADAEEWDPGAIRPDCIIVDPPRKGLSAGVIRKILELSPDRIVYVSCDPATLARDLRALRNLPDKRDLLNLPDIQEQRGYRVKDLCVVDMFPRTANVECCCLLVKE